MDAYNIYITRKYLAKIPVEYELLRKRYPEQLPSLGEIVGWERDGTELMQTLLMRSLELDGERRTIIRWLDAVCNVLWQLNHSEGRARKTHNRSVAVVLRGRVIDAMSMEGIRDEFFHRRVGVEYVADLYEEALKLVAKEAERMELLLQTSE